MELAVFWSALVGASRKRIRVYCDREEGQRAQNRRRPHVTLARSEERAANSASGVFRVLFLVAKKKRSQPYDVEYNKIESVTRFKSNY